MLNNEEFLNVIKQSFASYLHIGTSRSTAKLKILHGNIAKDLEKELGKDFTIKSQGYKEDSEGCIEGKYYPKNVDITINYKGKPVAGYAVKFVMRNYSQNSNNYFENMLGETVNLRANGIPYFQIFIVFDKVPYYKKGGEFAKYEIISKHNFEKYLKLSNDNPETFLHTPDKTLVSLISLKEKKENYRFKNDKDYAEYYKSILEDEDFFKYSNRIEDTFGNAVILNNYSEFIKRTCDIIWSKIKE
jgi:asparagine N-glycosylation enzyme membrane subunit Stt3